MAIASLILGIIGIVSSILVIGIIPAMIGLGLGAAALSRKKGDGMAIAGIAVSSVAVLLSIIIFVAFIRDTRKDVRERLESSVSENETIGENELAKDDAAEEIEANDESINPADYETVFYMALFDNSSAYNKHLVRTTVCVSGVYSSSFYTNENISRAIYFEMDDPDVNVGDYVTVRGVANSSDSRIYLEDVTIENVANEPPADYVASLDAYNEELRAQFEYDFNSFVEEAVTVSYDDLRRYPDTYNGAKLKLTIYITKVKPDGWVFQGDIFASYQGSEIAVRDDRQTREPRFLEGDTVTVYAIGCGLDKIQVWDKSSILPRLVNEYEVPGISVIYTDYDKPTE